MTEESKISARQQRRLEKGQETIKTAGKNGTTKWVQIRMFPIWLRILFVILLLVGAGMAGLMVGYGLLGEGDLKNALKWETYQHMIDIKDGK